MKELEEGVAGTRLIGRTRSLESGPRRAPGRLHCLRVDAPLLPLPEVLRRWPAAAHYYEPERGAGLVGVGEAAVLRASGPGRLAALKQSAAEVFERLDVRGDGEHDPALGPRFFGAFAFDDILRPGSLWSPFGAACFTLPRLTYTRTGDRAVLSLVAPPSMEAEAELLWAQEALSRPAPPSGFGKVSAERRAWASEGIFETSIREALQAIRMGDLKKLVLSRELELGLSGPVDVGAILVSLKLETGTARFLSRAGEACFFGASPELLVRKMGLSLETEALAGTALAPQAESLRTDPKNLAEHAFVVDHLAEVLSRFCREVEAPASPELRAAGRLVHLRTPLASCLFEPRHVLDVAEALHPTPAVCGVPAIAARAMIRTLEPHDRGLYSGAVGWFDAAGDGELRVALRCGLFAGDRLLLFAGAGLVAASDWREEAREVENKMTPILAALEVSR